MERTQGGRYATQYTTADVQRAFSETVVPVMTASEVAEQLGCSTPTARDLLEELVTADELARKEVGARAVVYVDTELCSGWPRYYPWQRVSRLKE